MKLTIRHVYLWSTDDVDSWIEQRLLALEPRLQIHEARVCLERQRDLSPAFRVHVHLVTPGQDVFAEGRDHTLVGSINKALRAVDAKVDHRWLKRAQRVRSNRQAPASFRNGGGQR
ncbi:MAG: HPF/RaiA family ribosome-associated protein [Verrucomicrobia bacterium]|nr:HPF/RaiA family ribosome-associated protein [Verrucomicrobiota bacterium]